MLLLYHRCARGGVRGRSPPYHREIWPSPCKKLTPLSPPLKDPPGTCSLFWLLLFNKANLNFGNVTAVRSSLLSNRWSKLVDRLSSIFLTKSFAIVTWPAMPANLDLIVRRAKPTQTLSPCNFSRATEMVASPGCTHSNKKKMRAFYQQCSMVTKRVGTVFFGGWEVPLSHNHQ